MELLLRYSNYCSPCHPSISLEAVTERSNNPKVLKIVQVTSERGLMGHGPSTSLVLLWTLFRGLRTKASEIKPPLHQITFDSHYLTSAYHPSRPALLLGCCSTPKWKKKRTQSDTTKDGIFTLLEWCCFHANKFHLFEMGHKDRGQTKFSSGSLLPWLLPWSFFSLSYLHTLSFKCFTYGISCYSQTKCLT